MEENAKERPALSGLDEIFASNAMSAPATPESEGACKDGQSKDTTSHGSHCVGDTADETSSDDRPCGDGQKRKGRHSDRNRRRNRRSKESHRQDAQSTQRDFQPDEAATLAQPDTNLQNENDGGDDADLVITDTDHGCTEVIITTSAPESVEVVGVRFKDTSKTYYFAPGDTAFHQGDHVIVETSRGVEYGSISVANTNVPASAIVPPLRDVLRRASDEDTARHEENLAKAKDAFSVCLGKIREHELEMKLIDAEYTFDQSKLTFYFSADGRVDFRDLVKDLASVFRTRIELRQIGIRDEAKLVGGLGVCGRPFCCSTFLSDFVQVSIKMAKEQNLSLNSAKISGACGRLMCCLRYEHDTYAEEIKKTPSVGSRVKSADGIGVVIESAPLRAKVKVRFGDETNHTIREYSRDDVTVLPKNRNDD